MRAIAILMCCLFRSLPSIEWSFMFQGTSKWKHFAPSFWSHKINFTLKHLAASSLISKSANFGDGIILCWKKMSKQTRGIPDYRFFPSFASLKPSKAHIFPLKFAFPCRRLWKLLTFRMVFLFSIGMLVCKVWDMRKK